VSAGCGPAREATAAASGCRCTAAWRRHAGE
jgi:hypothetical protein